MKIEEYKTIRDEMLQRFKWTTELSFFSVVSTGALLSWLSTKSSDKELNPFLFICVGVGILLFVFFSYLNILRAIYNQGGFLVFFHELGSQDFRWHIISRTQNELIGGKSDWGADGKRGGWLLILLLFTNIFGPLIFLKDNILSNFDWFKILTVIIAITIIVFLVIIMCQLFNTKKFMKKNMDKWRRIKENISKESNLPEITLENVLKTSKKNK